MTTTPDPCPCGRSLTYDACCGRLHAGTAEATTAEQLMRARYSAFAMGDAAYLERTWAGATRPASVRFTAGQRWTGLEVRATAAGGLFDEEGEVEFVAHHARAGIAGALHERSRFVREDGRWVYLGAVPLDPWDA